VDAAVYEVGLGGEYDATNVIAQPAAAGISTLGIDHVDILGHTIEEIAWHKAGILKHGSPAFSVEQLPAAAGVVAQRAKEKDVGIEIVHVDPRLKDVRIAPDAKFQKQNASLAISLTETVMKRLEPGFKLPPDTLPKEFVDGLEQVVLRGRCETKVEGNIRWFIDGAHTADSLRVSAKWFGGESAKHAAGKRVLIFNQQGREEAVELLEGLHNGVAEQGLVIFDHVVFCTNITYAEGYKKDFVNVMYDPAAIKGMTMQKAFKEKWEKMDPKATVVLSETIEGALRYVRELAEKEGEVQALVTGSLHLVGGALGVLEGGDAFQHLTLQGGVAHSDIFVKSGSTRLLPFSQRFEEGFMAWRLKDFSDYFTSNYVSLPLEMGDGLFFNPALFHAAGENQTVDFVRKVNLLQVSSAFGKTMENIDSLPLVSRCWDDLRGKYDCEGLSHEVVAFVSSVASGYPFPTNLDKRVPGLGGLAPDSEQDILFRGLAEKWDRERVCSALCQIVDDSKA
ncbi:hypothetical protein V491_05599, partial [Pseudogymnoascus sp. VKM F-3775]